MVALELSIGVGLAALGCFLLFMELAHPGALLFLPASVLLAAGIIYIAFPSGVLLTPIGLTVILLVAVGSGLAEIPYLRWVAPTHHPMSTTAAGLEGENAVVTVAVIPNTLKGKVRVRTQIWSATANIPIPAGTTVRVVKGEGVSLTVEPIPPTTSPPTAARDADK